MDRDQPEPDRPDHARQQQLLRGVRARQRAGDPAEQRPEDPRRAQGGIWTYDEATGTWIPRTDNQTTLSIGAISIAPSNDAVVYAGTGEGNLSGDSYFGNGFLKSTDGGIHWAPIGGDTFPGVSISKIAIDPTNANHLYASVIRGRGGQPPADADRYHEVRDLGVDKRRRARGSSARASRTSSTARPTSTMDPGNPNDPVRRVLGRCDLSLDRWWQALGASSWPASRRTRPSGPAAGPASLSGSRIPAGQARCCTPGSNGPSTATDQPSRIWKSVNGGAWQLLPAGAPGESTTSSTTAARSASTTTSIEVDPTNANTVYALGPVQLRHRLRRRLPFDRRRPDLEGPRLGPPPGLPRDRDRPGPYLAGRSSATTAASGTRSTRAAATAPADPVDGERLAEPQRHRRPEHGRRGPHRTGLRITQFTSIANVPTIPIRVWGGTQDNGTLRKSAASTSWFDVESGDGGQVHRRSDRRELRLRQLLRHQSLTATRRRPRLLHELVHHGGINLADRSEFYVPEIMNQGNPNQLFLGTYRRLPDRQRKGRNGARRQMDGDQPRPHLRLHRRGAERRSRVPPERDRRVRRRHRRLRRHRSKAGSSFSPDAVTNAHPDLDARRQGHLPEPPGQRHRRRPVELTRSRTPRSTASTPPRRAAAATSSRRPTAASIGRTSARNIPDAPVNSLQIDASYPNTIYAGTDVGPFVTYNGGQSWQPLGSGFPTVEVWQLDLDPPTATCAPGTHGRGAWTMTTGPRSRHSSSARPTPASRSDPEARSTTRSRVSNIGNADATGVTVTDPIPGNTTFAGRRTAATQQRQGHVDRQAVAAGDTLELHFRATISAGLATSVKSIVDDGLTVTSAQGVGATGSAHSTPIAPSHAARVAPASQTDGAHVGSSVTYPVHITNLGFSDDTYSLGSPPAPSPDRPRCVMREPTSSISVASGQSADVCLKVAVPGGAANGATDTATLTVTSTGDASVHLCS